MAKADFEHTGEIWTINDAFSYLVKVVGLADQIALRQMSDKIQQGKLPVWVNGHMAPRPDWMSVALSSPTSENNGEVQILSIAPGLGWDPTAYVFSVAADNVRRLWRPKPDKAEKARIKRPRDRVIELFNGLLKEKIRRGMMAYEVHRLVAPHYRTSRETVERAFRDYWEQK